MNTWQTAILVDVKSDLRGIAVSYGIGSGIYVSRYRSARRTEGFKK